MNLFRRPENTDIDIYRGELVTAIPEGPPQRSVRQKVTIVVTFFLFAWAVYSMVNGQLNGAAVVQGPDNPYLEVITESAGDVITESTDFATDTVNDTAVQLAEGYAESSAHLESARRDGLLTDNLAATNLIDNQTALMQAVDIQNTLQEEMRIDQAERWENVETRRIENEKAEKQAELDLLVEADLAADEKLKRQLEINREILALEAEEEALNATRIANDARAERESWITFGVRTLVYIVVGLVSVALAFMLLPIAFGRGVAAYRSQIASAPARQTLLLTKNQDPPAQQQHVEPEEFFEDVISGNSGGNSGNSQNSRPVDPPKTPPLRRGRRGRAPITVEKVVSGKPWMNDIFTENQLQIIAKGVDIWKSVAVARAVAIYQWKAEKGLWKGESPQTQTELVAAIRLSGSRSKNFWALVEEIRQDSPSMRN